MSNIYIQEPPTSGKVVLKTTVGDIEIELWSKECPKASRNFIQLCLEGYYNNTVFHRVVPDFIVQGGDPTGTGEGGESIYGGPFKDEIHQRLRFVRRGLVAMANSGPYDNLSQFFFTLAACPDLQGKHTLFGKVVGDTLFNMIKIADCEIGENERPLQCHKILSTTVVNNPFSDIVPRCLYDEQKWHFLDAPTKQSSIPAKKNLTLLSFGDEAGEEEMEFETVSKKFSGKSKSAHDMLKDEKLSSTAAVSQEELFRSSVDNDEEEKKAVQEMKSKVKEKLTVGSNLLKSKKQVKPDIPVEEEEELDSLLWQERRDEERKKLENVRSEINSLKRDLVSRTKELKQLAEADDVEPVNPALEAYNSEKAVYLERKMKLPSVKTEKGLREEQTLAMLSKFKTKLEGAKNNATISAEADQVSTKRMRQENQSGDEQDEEDIVDDNWFVHSFDATVETLRQAKDANVRNEDTYEIYDPRNPITKMRREAAKHASKEKLKQRTYDIDGKR